MVSKRGIGSLWVVVIVAVVAVGGWYLYNSSSNISGAGTNVAPTQCIANPELAGWDDVQFAKIGAANFAQLNSMCNEKLVSIACGGVTIPGSSLKACVWNVKCGNGVIDADLEQCEGANLGGKTCADYGFAGGVLRCRNDCKADLSDCQ